MVKINMKAQCSPGDSIRDEFGEEGVKKLISWGIAALLFLLITSICVHAIFTPVTTRIEDNSGTYDIQEPIWSIEGLKSAAKIWEIYPDYRTSLIVSALFGLAGEFYCIFNLARVKKRENS